MLPCLFLLPLFSYFWMCFPASSLVLSQVLSLLYDTVMWITGSGKMRQYDQLWVVSQRWSCKFKWESWVIKERTSISFPSSSIIKWKRANSSKISMYLLCLLLLFWFCESFCWRTGFTWSLKNLETKVCLRGFCVTSPPFTCMKEGRSPTDCAWEGLCWQECHDTSCNSTGALTWALCFHYVLWDPAETYKDYGTKGLAFLKKRTNFTFIHFLPQMNGEKLQQRRKFSIQMSTNLEYKWAHNAFWGSITIVVLVFQKEKLEKSGLF